MSAFVRSLRDALAGRAPTRHVHAPLQPAGVLVAMYLHAPSGEPHLWLVRRPDRMRLHRGEVALPGGKRDPVDRDLLDTALREAEEEIGLPRAMVDVLGVLEDVVTITGFTITPYVGWVSAPFEPRPDAAEVARVLSASVATFLSPNAARTIPRGSYRRIVPAYDVDGEKVWGATARILRSLGEMVRDAGALGGS